MCLTWCSRTKTTVNECIHRQSEYDTNNDFFGIKLPTSTLPMGGKVWTENKTDGTWSLEFKKPNDKFYGKKIG